MPTRLWGVCFKKSAADLGEKDFPVKWFKFICPSLKSRMTETSTCFPVHLAYSSFASMNHQWTINLHDGYTSSNALMSVEYIPLCIPTLCHLLSTMFHFGVDFLHSNQNTQHDLSSLALPKGEMTSSFSWTSSLRSLFIKHYESEPYHQHQNKAAQHYGVVKKYINTLMNLTRAPVHCWLLCLVYVWSLLNVTVSPVLGHLTPIQVLTGHVPDISHFLHFSFWEPVYYEVDENESDHKFPSHSNEKRGYWVGSADYKGDHLTWKILTDETNQLITRSAVRSAKIPSPNLRLHPPQGGRINHKIRHLMCLLMAGLILADPRTSLLCPLSILMTSLGDLFYFLWMRMGRERELLSLIMSMPSVKIKFPEKINFIQAQD